MANQYQLVTVFSPVLGEEGLNTLTESIKSKIEASAESIDAVDVLGMKALAYEIDNQKEGYYVKYSFTACATLPKEIERVLKITDGVLRFLIVRVEE